MRIAFIASVIAAWFGLLGSGVAAAKNLRGSSIVIEGKYPDSRGNPYNMATRLDISDNYVDFFIGGDLIGKVPLNGTLKNTKSGRARCIIPTEPTRLIVCPIPKR